VTFLAGLVAFGLIWWLLKSYMKANPTFLAKNVRKAGGVLALVGAAFLVFRGRLDVAIPLGGFGAWLLDLPGFSMPGWAQRTTTAPGGTSRVRSRLIEMELDHGTGALRGRVVEGVFAGRELDSLGESELADLDGLCRASDPEGGRLLEAYLDRRFPGRRKAAQGDGNAGPTGSDRNAMSEKEAYEILGLPPGAGEEDVRRAHRALMKKLHPDQGGSTYLATRVNQAKDVLLSRHR
jgi:uncharacterized membrane protein